MDNSSTPATVADDVAFQRQIREQVDKDTTPLKSDSKHTYYTVWLDNEHPLGVMYRCSVHVIQQGVPNFV